ncbi:endosomal transport [Desmophyllum pertusum]|uniref:Endosomal transport n=1 Tax=Desmophyllum pertusum TaxID=174260 RepID=A0A9W9Z7C2_9CNID|nr:endosomal transport [Desmophyllum pertusum]
MDWQEMNQDVFVDFVGVLTDVIEMVNNRSNILLRWTACQCLWELEMSYTGLLHAKLDHLYAQCAAENSPIFQSYMKGQVTFEQKRSAFSPTKLTKAIVSTQASLAAIVTSDHSGQSLHPRSLTLPENVDTRELKRAISFLMDNIGFLNTTGLFHVMFQLMQCVKLAELAPNTFKSQFITWVSTTDLSVFHVLLLLKLKFLGICFWKATNFFYFKECC